MQLSDLKKFAFVLPPELVAQHPVSPRDQAKLLVYDRSSKKITEARYRALPKILPKKTVLVLNNTKVIPARIFAKRPSGGRIEVFILGETTPLLYQVMLSRSLPIGETICLRGGLLAKVIRQAEQFYFLEINLSYPMLVAYLEQHGEMPIPPYIKKPQSLSKLKRQYQTVFAKIDGSVAAPTASLHFTRRLLTELARSDIQIEYLTLHVGLGTFLPLTNTQFKKKSLHEEFYEVAPTVWNRLKKQKARGYRIIPVGTTALRSLETLASQEAAGNLVKLSGKTDLFIQPGYQFKMADALVTNFHLPQTSLLLLVSAFINSQSETLALYKYAIEQQYRFYSFGDGMLIL